MRLLLALAACFSEALYVSKKEKEIPTLATSLAELTHVKKTSQDPPAEGTTAPGDDKPIDAEAYAEDWQNEHRSEPYPQEAVGKQHHPSFGATDLVERAFGFRWWQLIGIALVILATAYGVYTFVNK